LVSFHVPAAIKRFADKSADPVTFAPNAFLHIGEDESIQIILSKVEMGQGVWTTLPMLIAEELDCDWTKIKVQHSPVGKAYAHTAFGTQGTVGSSSTWSEFDRYRMGGATARVMLVEAAAKRMTVNTAECATENGFVIAAGKRLSYGAVAADASKLNTPAEVKLRDAKDWKYIGKSIPRLDIPEKINGQAKFGLDIQLDGLLTALVAHPPVFGGKVKSFDATKASAIKGVQDVVQIPTGVAVIADNFWAAKTGRDALTIDWEPGEGENVDSLKLLEEYRKLSKAKGLIAQEKGDVNTALQKAERTIEVEYTVPYLAHAAMEPLNCTVRLGTDKCEIWTGTQLPMMDQVGAAAILGLKPEQVIINMPFLGGGFGRRGVFDAQWVKEAVTIAKQSKQPVKLVWTREDDMKGGYYRPAYLHRIRVGVSNGLPTAWEHRVVGQSTFGSHPAADAFIHNGIDDSSVEGVKGSPYLETIADHSVELHPTKVAVPVLPWRSVGFSHTCFVMESLIDELAYTMGKDTVAYRRILLKNNPRRLAVLNLAAEKAEWSTPLIQKQFRGIATHENNGTCVAHVIELSVDEHQQIHVHRIVCAVDCGIAVNPDGVRAQMESGIVFGLTAALYGEITLEKGSVTQSNFHNYKMLRLNETPVIEVHIVQGTEKLGGTGEPGVPAVAPALTNALFAATGKRIRRLPVHAEDLKRS
jgi:isoquinoline 1-oxidoreductase beta subunit